MVAESTPASTASATVVQADLVESTRPQDSRRASPLLDCSAPAVDDYPQACAGRIARASQYGDCVPATDFREWGCLLLDASASLCPSAEPFRMTVVVERSEVALDCRGQRIEHAGGPRRPGIRFPKTRSVEGVTIERCAIVGTGFAGIEVLRNFRSDDGDAPGHRRIAISDVSVDSGKFGVYLGTRSRDVSLQRVTVRSASEVGIYVDADSSGVRLSEVEVASTQGREGIAIDSATEIIVERSVTRDNAGAGIRLYHNCGELRGSVCPIARSSGASRNVIRHNRIEDGVIVASRQGQRYEAGLCADLGGQAGPMRDVAQENQITDNVFIAPPRWAALSVHDGNNAILRNRFVARQGARCLALQLAPRAYGGALVQGVALEGIAVAENDFGACEVQLRDVDPAGIELGVNYGAGGVCRGLPAGAMCYAPRPAAQ